MRGSVYNSTYMYVKFHVPTLSILVLYKLLVMWEYKM